MPDNRNLIIAIVLSLAVLIAWQFLVAGPQMEKLKQQHLAEQQRQEQVQQTQQAAGGTAGPAAGMTAGGAAAPTGVDASQTLTREAALGTGKRIAIQNAALTGSINLTGARIDDLRLSEFHETVDKTSPTIVLLSPVGAPDAYFAEFGWASDAEQSPLPGPTTEWSAPEGAKLTAASPVTLTYDNGAGLVFTRTIALDDKYMFTVTDAVDNKGSGAVALTPFGRVTRIGEPHVAGYWILHEGLIGVFGDQGLKEEKYKSIKDDKQQTYADVSAGWVGITDKYWAAALVPDQGKPFTGRFAYADQGQPVYQADFHGAAETIAPGASATATSHLFAGAKQVAIVDGYAKALNAKLFDRLID
jgi:YidC/Oxa1 family membrane protein insertase